MVYINADDWPLVSFSTQLTMKMELDKSLLVAVALLAVSAFTIAQEDEPVARDVFSLFIPNKIRPGIDITTTIYIRGEYDEAEVTVKFFKTEYETVVREIGPPTTFRRVRRDEEMYAISQTYERQPSESYDLVLQPPIDMESISNVTTEVKMIKDGVVRKTLTDHIIGRQHSRVSKASKSVSVFIQMDKPLYRASQMVQMRAIVLKPDLTPFDGSCTIEITDSKSNILRRWSDLELEYGVASESMQLSDRPILGTWTVKVTANGETETKSFRVEEYVLPKFGLSLEVTEKPRPEQEMIRATFKAEYTFGKGVEGMVTFQIRNGNLRAVGDWNETARTYIPLALFEYKDIELDEGKHEIVLRRSQFKALFQEGRINSGSSILVIANFTEELTGNKKQLREFIRFTTPSTNSRINVNFERAPSTFKPGMTFSGFVRAYQGNQQNLTSPVNATIKVRITTKFQPERTNTTFYCTVITKHTEECPEGTERVTTSREPRISGVEQSDGSKLRVWQPPAPRAAYTTYYLEQVELNIGLDGVLAFEINLPINASSASLELRDSNGRYYDSHYISSSDSPTDSYLQVNPANANRKVRVDRVLRYRVILNKPGQLVFYSVIARGTIVLSNSQFMNRQSNMISFGVTADMTPSAKLMVYYINQFNNEVVVDSVSFDVNEEGAFKHDVSLTYSKSEAEPGETVNLRVQAEPQSFVGLLAIDTSLLLLGEGHEVTKDNVLRQVRQYNDDYYYRPYYLRSYWWPRPISGHNAAQVISNTGLAMLTNAFVFNGYNEDEFELELEEASQDSSNSIRRGSSAGQSRARKLSKSSSFDQDQSSASFEINIDSEDRGAPTTPAAGAVRTFFPETWIWLNATTSRSGSVYVPALVPDTITSWVASAFAINDRAGLGLSETAKLTVFKPFFVSLILPFSVVRAEELVIQAIVFNYLQDDISVTVTLPESDEYKAIVIDNDGEISYVKQPQQAVINIETGQGETVSFPIVPSMVGMMRIRVSAQSSVAGDIVEKELLVEPEGIEKSYSKHMLIDLTDDSENTEFSESANLPVPDDHIPGSKRIEFSLIGNILGSAIQDLSHLIRLPSGCGEQNMINFAPTVYVTEYLQKAGLLTAPQRQRSLNYMRSGYGRQLFYKRNDGSYSAFGSRDRSGSTWLTAFVVKSFKKASQFIYIDEVNVLNKGTRFLLKQQNQDGSFRERGRLISKNLLGGGTQNSSKESYTRTAYVLTALTEMLDAEADDQRLQSDIREAIENSTSYLLDGLRLDGDHSKDLYMLGVISYALKQVGSDSADDVLAKLNSYANNTDGLKFWDLPEPNNYYNLWSFRHWAPPYQQSNSIEIELAAYAMLAYTDRDDWVDGGIPILRWIVQQRNNRGGFQSTQDTVVGLQALSAFAMLIGKELNMDVTLRENAPTNAVHTYDVDLNNALILQMRTLDQNTDLVTVSATGEGIALASFAVSFNEEADDSPVAFDTTARVIFADKRKITVKVCTRWLFDNATGMAILEIGIPTGFEADVSTIKRTSDIADIEEANRKVIIYFHSLTERKTCVELDAVRSGLVAKNQAVAVRVYDYYEPEKQQTIFYSSRLLKDTNVCDVCGIKCAGCDRYFAKRR